MLGRRLDAGLFNRTYGATGSQRSSKAVRDRWPLHGRNCCARDLQAGTRAYYASGPHEHDGTRRCSWPSAQKAAWPGRCWRVGSCATRRIETAISGTPEQNARAPRNSRS
ncbi:MAG: hypothetical protein JJ931_09760, partial [Henriciella sp.]|nr:hypothetical protein [Henriciella sp.]